MSLSSRQYANSADDSYVDYKIGHSLPGEEEKVAINGVQYKMLEQSDNPRTGYQGTIYQRVDTGEIVVAHRGTEFDRQPVRDGVLVDGGMPARFAVPGGIGSDGSMELPDHLRPAIHPPYRDEPGDWPGPVPDMRNPLDKQPPPDATASQLFDHLHAAMKTDDDEAFKRALATVADADISRGFHAQAVATVDAQERQAALDAQQRQQQQQSEQMEAQTVRVRGPSMH